MLSADVGLRRGSFELAAVLEAAEGAPLVIVGESGAGKSTLLRILAGLDRPDRGRVVSGGETWVDTARGVLVPAHRRSVGFVAQDFALFPHLSAEANVAFGPRAAGWSRRRSRARARELLERVGLVTLAGRRPGELSGGQQQRVALARALALEPALLLLDEPLSALDLRSRRELRAELAALFSERTGVTLYVTHSPLEAMAFGQRIAVVEGGRIVQVGTREDLLRQPRSAAVAESMGLNFFRGSIVRRREGGLVVVRSAASEVLAVDPGEDGELCLAVSPREVTLSLAPPEGSAQNVFRAPVAEVIPEPPLGERVRVVLAGDPPLVAEVTGETVTRMGLAPGLEVYAAFKATGVAVYR